jgi:hypothetical protein
MFDLVHSHHALDFCMWLQSQCLLVLGGTVSLSAVHCRHAFAVNKEVSILPICLSVIRPQLLFRHGLSQSYSSTMTVAAPTSTFLPHHPQSAPTKPAPASDLLAYPHKQQPLSQPPSVGISMSSAAVVVDSDQGP